MRHLVYTLLVICFSNMCFSQGTIETRLCFSDTTSFPFTGEWQYLSTDIFLLNGQQFNRVINDLYVNPKKKGKNRGLANEELEYLYMTAQLMNVKYFGDNDVVYPLYNFQINKDKENKYQTHVSDNIESIRIIDNLPLYAASNNIDAKIDVKAITYNDRDNILGFFGKQLQNLAAVGRPSFAVLSLIGEMGSFIESNARKKEYRFSSTIRLFEQKNFDQRLHSVRVYVMTTPNSPSPRLNTVDLSNYLDTCSIGELNKELIMRLLPFRTYPLIVIANYKSVYHMQGVSGDEVNFSTIDKRKVNIENNYRDKLISEDTYRQEKNFTDFLTVFANFKNNLELYTLNARTGNADAAKIALGSVVQGYISLIQEYDVVNFKYKSNSTFKSTFKTEYASIVDFAGFYLENDHNLRSIKSMSNTLLSLNKNGIPQKPEDKENVLRALRGIDNLTVDFQTKTKEGQNISLLISQVENSLFLQVFRDDIAKLDTSPVTSERNELLTRLSEKQGATNCKLCRDRVQASIKNYFDRLEVKNKTEVNIKYKAFITEKEPLLINLVRIGNAIHSNMSTVFPDKGNLEAEAYERRIKELDRDIDNLKNLIYSNVDDKSSIVISSLMQKIEETIKAINTNIQFIQTNKPNLINGVPEEHSGNSVE